MQTELEGIFYILILIISVVIHEVSHGFVAEYFGDDTARNEGRLTLNPIPHIDLFGSIILPAFLVFTNSSFLIGWAKPVPFNPENFNDKKTATIAVASAGVLANFFIAIFFGLILRFSTDFNLPTEFNFIISSIVILNLSLAIFNLVPIPPLDGSKILFQLLPKSFSNLEKLMEDYALIFILIFIIYFSQYLSPIIFYLNKIIIGF